MSLTGSTGWILPGTVTPYQLSDYAMSSQSSLDNIKAVDGVSLGIFVNTSQYWGLAKTKDFGLNVPPGSTITGIFARAYGRQTQSPAGGTTYFDLSMYSSEVNSSAILDSLSRTQNFPSYAGSGFAQYSMSATKVLNYDPERVNDPLFGLTFFTSHQSGWDATIDYIEIKIDYNLPDMVTTIGMIG